jgi:hypothetical protein
MYNISDKVILVDCDGVLVDWEYGFHRWMKGRGYEAQNKAEYEVSKTYSLDKKVAKELVRSFNESAHIGYLPSLRDSIKYVKKLHEEHGYVFHCITSLSKDPYAAKSREKNLQALFGKTPFELIVCLDCGADKDEALLPYKDTGCFWIEDKPENALVGDSLGLQPILVEHEYNKNWNHPSIPKVSLWKQIYEMVSV